MRSELAYRVNSTQATRFRQWSTPVLREYLTRGHVLDKARFEKNAAELEQALTLSQKAAQSPELTGDAGRGLINIVSRYTQTFLLLQRYDEGLLEEPIDQDGGTLPSADDAMVALGQLKRQLMDRGEATQLFAQVRDCCISCDSSNLPTSTSAVRGLWTLWLTCSFLIEFRHVRLGWRGQML